MSKLTTEQRQRIFGIAIQLGIYEKGNPNDNLHLLVYSTTGKESIGKLTIAEAYNVITAMIKLRGYEENNKRKKSKASRPGMITSGQIKKVWFYMYRLAELDEEPSNVSLAFRLCKIIEKELKVTAAEADPFRFIDFNKGSRLIDILKRYIESTTRKRGKVTIEA